jgi:transposase-like protein
MAPTSLAQVRQAAVKLRRAEEGVRKARKDLRAAIVAARSNGESLAAIARTLGVTRQRVSQLLER